MLPLPFADLSLMFLLKILICKYEDGQVHIFLSTFIHGARLFNANVKQVINVTQIVASKMISAGKQGSIVNVSSQVMAVIFILALTLPITHTAQYIINYHHPRHPKQPWQTTLSTVPPRVLLIWLQSMNNIICNIK